MVSVPSASSPALLPGGSDCPKLNSVGRFVPAQVVCRALGGRAKASQGCPWALGSPPGLMKETEMPRQGTGTVSGVRGQHVVRDLWCDLGHP